MLCYHVMMILALECVYRQAQPQIIIASVMPCSENRAAEGSVRSVLASAGKADVAPSHFCCLHICSCESRLQWLHSLLASMFILWHERQEAIPNFSPCPVLRKELQSVSVCRLQIAQAVARSYQGLQPHAEALDQLRIIHTFAARFDADTYIQTQHSVKQLRQDIMQLRQAHCAFHVMCIPPSSRASGDSTVDTSLCCKCHRLCALLPESPIRRCSVLHRWM